MLSSARATAVGQAYEGPGKKGPTVYWVAPKAPPTAVDSHTQLKQHVLMKTYIPGNSTRCALRYSSTTADSKATQSHQLGQTTGCHSSAHTYHCTTALVAKEDDICSMNTCSLSSSLLSPAVFTTTTTINSVACAQA